MTTLLPGAPSRKRSGVRVRARPRVSSMKLAQTLARVLLGSAMVGAGVLHLTTQREEFRAQVPSWFPLDEDFTVLASVLPKQKRLIGGLLALFYVAIFPGNIAQYVEGVDAFGLDTDRARFIRLFFQPVLVLVALFGGGWLQRRRSSTN